MTTKEFFDKIVNDSEIGGKLAAAKTPEECYEIAKAAGLTDTLDAFTAAATEFNQQASKMDPSEIDAVVGGGTETTVTVTSAAVPGAASAALV